MLFLCVSVYCHRVTTQLQLINIIIIIIKTTGKIIVLYIFIFKFLDSNLEDKRYRKL